MKAIVHIGTEKTGTTSIQEYLYENQRQLNKAGFYYIQDTENRNSRALVSYCMREDKYDDFFRARGIMSLKEKKLFKCNFFKSFQKEMESIPKRINTVIISSEHFHSRTNTQEEVANVYELLSSYFSEIKIICYLREQVETCTSLYSTAIKSGKSPSFSDFILNCKPENVYYNYFEMLTNWERVFGLESLDVSLFDSNQLLNQNLIDDFTAKINPSLVGTLNKNIKTENESLTYSGQVLGKAINKIYSSNEDGPQANIIRIKCQEIIYRECQGKGEQASIDTRRRIYSEFTESNEKVRRKYFPDRDVLFDQLTDGTEIENTIDDGYIDVLSSIFNVIMEESNRVALPDIYANLFRDSALIVEKDNFKSAYELMKLAYRIRPTGPFIKQKLGEYRQKSG